jgi:hypothetical protein
MESPDRNGVADPITPDRRTTGTTAISPRQRFGSQGRSAARVRVIAWRRVERIAAVVGSLAMGH